MPTPEEVELRAGVNQMKAVAVALLVGAAIAFVISRALEAEQPWLGYVRATAEAAMVGALADWFAVNALFKRPLGLPIPHTAIVPERKDEIGVGLGNFIQENFLAGDVVAEKLEATGLSRTLGEWLQVPENARTVVTEVSTIAAAVSQKLSHDKNVELVVDTMLRDRLAEKGEQLEHELPGFPELHSWTKALFSSMHREFGEATHMVDSAVRPRIEAELVVLAHHLANDEALQARIDKWIISVIVHIADSGRAEIGHLIAQTVEDWDPQELVDRVEPHVGRDLQFIRINGTLVGGLAGLLIFIGSEFLF